MGVRYGWYWVAGGEADLDMQAAVGAGVGGDFGVVGGGDGGDDGQAQAVRDPAAGIGKPEPLRHMLAGAWSRRIAEEHRIVNLVDGEDLVILRARFTTSDAHFCRGQPDEQVALRQNSIRS